MRTQHPPRKDAAPAPAADAPSKPAPTSTADILAAARAQSSGTSQPAPSSTSDILAAARAQAGGKTAAKTGGDAPKSTSDILAAARSQGAQGAKKSAPTGTADILAAARAPGEERGSPREKSKTGCHQVRGCTNRRRSHQSPEMMKSVRGDVTEKAAPKKVRLPQKKKPARPPAAKKGKERFPP